MDSFIPDFVFRYGRVGLFQISRSLRIKPNNCCGESFEITCKDSLALDCWNLIPKTRRRMARERRGAGSSLVSMETHFYKQYMKDVL